MLIIERNFRELKIRIYIVEDKISIITFQFLISYLFIQANVSEAC